MEPHIYQSTMKELMEKYHNICTVNSRKPSSFEIFSMAGEALTPYEYYTNEIVQYIHKWFRFLLRTIVVDFIRDERGIIYFLGVKAFTPVYEFVDIQKPFSIKEYLKSEKNLNKIYKTLTCKLCMLSYPQAKITKLVTFKLLLKLKENLFYRNSALFNHIHVSWFNFVEA